MDEVQTCGEFHRVSVHGIVIPSRSLKVLSALLWLHLWFLSNREMDQMDEIDEMDEMGDIRISGNAMYVICCNAQKCTGAFATGFGAGFGWLGNFEYSF